MILILMLILLDRSGFGSTAIESLTTAIIMGEKTIMDRIMWFIGSATFTVTKLVAEEVNVYEATIRLIGSMVSGSSTATLLPNTMSAYMLA